jgi:hypothetical protein
MKNVKLMLIAALFFSASVASAAITYDTIDFQSALNGTNYAALDTTSNVGITGGKGYFLDAYSGNNVMQFNFTEAVRFTSIDLGYVSGFTAPKMVVYGISGGETQLLSINPVPVNGTYAISDTTAYDGLKITQNTYYGRIDNIVYNFGEEDPPPTPDPDPLPDPDPDPLPDPDPDPDPGTDPVPVPAPGAIVLAGLGTCVATWIRKHRFA